MKGITPVIAIILLLLITISMTGFAFIFLQRSLDTATESTESNLENQLNRQGQQFAIDSVDDAGDNIYVRHIGTVTSDTADIAVFIDGAIATCVWGPSGAWPPGGAPRACNTAITCAGTTDISITTPGNTDSISC